MGRTDSARHHPIGAILDERGMVHHRFAARLGLSGPDFSHILAGRRLPPADFYERAARELGVPVQWLRPAAAATTERQAA